MSIVARRYAKALMNLAARDNQVEPVTGGLDEMADLLAESETLLAFLTEPKVALAAKEAVVAELLDKVQVPPLVNTFVRFLTRKRRVALLGEIRTEFHDLADERMGRANADVTVAAELTAAQQDTLRSRLQGLTGKDVRLRVQVDPDILGGVVARIGSIVWDSSLRNQLTRIEQTIAKA